MKIGRSRAIACLVGLLVGGIIFASGSLAAVSDGQVKHLLDTSCSSQGLSCVAGFSEAGSRSDPKSTNGHPVRSPALVLTESMGPIGSELFRDPESRFSLAELPKDSERVLVYIDVDGFSKDNKEVAAILETAKQIGWILIVESSSENPEKLESFLGADLPASISGLSGTEAFRVIRSGMRSEVLEITPTQIAAELALPMVRSSPQMQYDQVLGGGGIGALSAEAYHQDVESTGSYRRTAEPPRKAGELLTLDTVPSTSAGALIPEFKFEFQKRNSCAYECTLCGFGAAITIASCVADYFTAGALTSACVAAMTEAGGTCAICAGECARSGAAPAHTVTDRAGAFSGYRELYRQAQCGDHHRVHRMRWEHDGRRVKRVFVDCTDGTQHSIGHSGGRSWTQLTCGRGDLMRGFRARSGWELDALGGVCHTLGSWGGSWTGEVTGGSGGGFGTFECPLGQYLRGVDGFIDDTSSWGGGNINNLRGLCR
jgi:hypothetical protein